MSVPNYLTNASAVVSGGGGGLGRALCHALANAGVPVTLLGRNADALAETASANSDLLNPVVCDVASDADVAAAFANARARFGPVKLLINNAAVYPRRDFLATTPADFMQTVDINLGGLVRCSRAALDDMVADGTGRIMNVSTFADIAPLPTSAEYSVSKGAARILGRAMIADLSDRFPGIVINDWMPGMLATKMGIPDGLDPQTAAQWGAALALWHDPSLTGTIFEQDHEIVQGNSLKRKIKNLVLLRKPSPARQIPMLGV